MNRQKYLQVELIRCLVKPWPLVISANAVDVDVVSAKNLQERGDAEYPGERGLELPGTAPQVFEALLLAALVAR